MKRDGERLEPPPKKTKKVTCPDCGGTDLDHYPDDCPHAYCYTCKKSVQVLKKGEIK